MPEMVIEDRELSSVRDWERWMEDRVTKEFFDTLKARISVIRDELEQSTKDDIAFKQGEIANARFMMALPEVVISDLNQKEKDDARRSSSNEG